MRILISFLLFSLTIACHAENESAQDCSFTSSNVHLVTPKADNIANTYWQKSTDGYESVDRLYVNYKDGSVAIIEHKYCSMYNFEVAYYTGKKSDVSSITSLAETIKTLLAYSGIKDDSINNALIELKGKLEIKKFSAEKPIFAGANQSNLKNQAVEYSLSYMPIEDSSLHKAALFVYMAIGGEH